MTSVVESSKSAEAAGATEQQKAKAAAIQKDLWSAAIDLNVALKNIAANSSTNDDTVRRSFPVIWSKNFMTKTFSGAPHSAIPTCIISSFDCFL